MQELTTLLDFIKQLSEKDPKTLAQKTLKTAEEVGELAKAVLPFEDAPQTRHRFSDRSKITEEVADVVLCALSVGYNLGLTHDELIDRLWEKATYWGSLQTREAANPYPLPFELHVTVKPTEKERFKLACQELGVKAVMLDLQNNFGATVLEEMMTTSKLLGTNSQAYEEIQRISRGLKERGFQVLREKIETVPWHPSAPSKQGGNQKMGEGGYFEAHIETTITPTSKPLLQKVAIDRGAVISQNLRKKFADGSEIVLITLRHYHGFAEDFQKQVEELKLAMTANGVNPEKEMIEYSLYDTTVEHDLQWIGKV